MNGDDLLHPNWDARARWDAIFICVWESIAKPAFRNAASLGIISGPPTLSHFKT